MAIDTMRVAVVDDHVVFAESLAARLSLEPDMDVVVVAFSEHGVAGMVDHLKVDVAVIDYDLGYSPGTTGLTLGEDLLQRRPDVHIVFVTGVQDESFVAEGARLGMSGWVPKDASIDLLLHVIRGAQRGETYIPARLLTRVLNILTRQSGKYDPAALVGLTPREIDVLSCMVDGMGRAEIARQLQLSQNTVRTHVQRVLQKLGVHSSLSAVARARETGLLGLVPTHAGSRQ
ncbi:MAG TPA: response regulator transcription factor [Candidatus Nanopelagicales bacterium]